MGVRNMRAGRTKVVSWRRSGRKTDKLDQIQLKPQYSRIWSRNVKGTNIKVGYNFPFTNQANGSNKTNPMVCWINATKVKLNGKISNGNTTRFTRFVYWRIRPVDVVAPSENEFHGNNPHNKKTEKIKGESELLNLTLRKVEKTTV
jgi:hypothetical protein